MSLKTMKRLPALLLTLAALFALTACGSSGAKSTPVEEVFGLDLESTEKQPMSEERGERDAIYAAVKEHFGDVTFFSDSAFTKMTYDDLKELIGIDASCYYYDADASAQVFLLETCDYEYASIAFYFRFDELYALGSTNMKG